jgi:putative ABC transport system permease protein
LELQKQAPGTGKNPNANVALLPLSTMRKLHPELRDFMLLVKADSTENLPIVVDEVRGYLRRMRKLLSDNDDDLAVMTTDTFRFVEADL